MFGIAHQVQKPTLLPYSVLVPHWRCVVLPISVPRLNPLDSPISSIRYDDSHRMRHSEIL